MESLRSRQRAFARQAIVEACADLVTERRHLDFAMREVADRAGVSLRTVYNHFASREELLDALGVMLDEQMAARGGADAADLGDDGGGDVVSSLRTMMHLFDELGGISEAFAQMPMSDIGRDEGRVERTRRIVDNLVQQMPNAPPGDAEAIGLTLRHLLSHRSWFWLTREYGLSTDQVIEVVTWAIATLVAAAEAGDVPSRALGHDVEDPPAPTKLR